MKKKLISMILAASMSASLLAGCSTFESDNSSKSTKTTKGATEAAKEDTEDTADKGKEETAAKETASEDETAAGTDETKDAAKSETEVKKEAEEAKSEAEAESETGTKADTEAEAEAESTGSGSFVWACPSLIGMNPVKSNSNNDYDVYYLTQAGLVRPTEDGYEADLAESWDISKDKLTYTFHLRDSKWSDGEPVKAADFVYAFSQYLDPELAWINQSYLTYIEGAQAYASGEGKWEDVAVKAVDDKTLEIKVTNPGTDLLTVLAFITPYPLRQDKMEEYGDAYGSSVDKSLYSGPYTCTEWILDSKYVLTKNDTYWDAKDNWQVQTIEGMEIADDGTKVAMFENGEIDAMYTIGGQYVEQMTEDGATVTPFSSNGIEAMYFNENTKNEAAKEVLSNADFRKALSYALNREGIAQAVNPLFHGYNRITTEVYTDENGKKITDEYPVDCAPLTGDEEKAKEYLASALKALGYADASELPEMTLMSYERDDHKLMGEMMVDAWKSILGITSIKYEQYPINTAIGNFYALSFDMFVIGTEGGVFPYSNAMNFKTGGDLNPGYWSNKEYDALIAKISESTEVKEQNEILNEAEQLIMDEGIYCPLYMQGQATVSQSYVENFSVAKKGYGYFFKDLKINK